MKIDINIKFNTNDRAIIYWIIAATFLFFIDKSSRLIWGFVPLVILAGMPVLFFFLFHKKDMFKTASKEKISMLSKIVIIVGIIICVIATVSSYIMCYNIYSMVPSTPEEASKVTGIMYYLSVTGIVSMLIVWFVELMNMKKLGKIFIATYFINAGVLASVCALICIMANLDVSAADSFESALRILNLKILGSITYFGTGVAASLIIAVSLKFLQSRKASIKTT